MCEEKCLLTLKELALVHKTTAETLLLEEQAKKVKAEAMVLRLGFCFKWLVVWLTVGGVVKLELVKGVAAWIFG